MFDKIKFGSVTFNIIIMGLIVLFSLFYLVQTNKIAVWGFETKELENIEKRFRRENKVLELQVAKLQSIEKIKDVSQKLNMVKVSRVDYVIPVGTFMAIK